MSGQRFRVKGNVTQYCEEELDLNLEEPGLEPCSACET